MSFVKFDNVHFAYDAQTEDEVVALKGVSFEVQEGEFVALAGHNGSGKSTLAKLCNGLFLPTKGTVTVDGYKTHDKKNMFEVRRTVGVVFQNPDNQMVASIIEDDIAFGPENLGLSPSEIRARVDWALDAVGMKAHAKGTPFRLSGGQKQRIAIAGILAIKPRVLVLDEATAMLDPLGRGEVLEVVKRLNREENMTVIMITHFMEEAALADRIVVLNKGEVAMQGGKELFERGAELAALGLDVPLATRVADALKKRGMDLPCGITEPQELEEAVLKLSQNAKKKDE